MQQRTNSLENRILAAHVLAALPASQNTADAHSQHLQGLLKTVHGALTSIPSPPTDPGAAQAAADVLGASVEGSWSQSALLQPAKGLSQYVSPLQRLEAVTLLIECLDETLRRRTEMSVPLPMTALVLLVSRLLAHRPSMVHRLSQHSPADRAQLHLLGGPLLNSGTAMTPEPCLFVNIHPWYASPWLSHRLPVASQASVGPHAVDVFSGHCCM